MHMEAASALFVRMSQQLLDAEAATRDKARGDTTSSSSSRKRNAGLPGRTRVTALDGKTRMTAVSALQAAARPLEVLLAADTTASGGDARRPQGYCLALQRLCQLRLQVLMLIQQQRQQQPQQEPSQAAARSCMLQLSKQRGCEQQAAELQKMMRGDHQTR